MAVKKAAISLAKNKDVSDTLCNGTSASACADHSMICRPASLEKGYLHLLLHDGHATAVSFPLYLAPTPWTEP